MKLSKIVMGALCAASISTAAHAQQLGIGTMAPGNLGYSIGSAIASVLSTHDIGAIVQPSGGTSAYLPLVDSGELDFGIANVIESGQAAAGEAGFEGHQLKNLRAVSVLFPFRVGLFVREDSGIETIADLKGKRIAYGFTNQVTLKKVVDAILATGDVKEGDFTPVMVPTVVRGMDDFSAGKADAAFFAIGGSKIAEVEASVGALRFLPVPTDAEAEKRLKAEIPAAYVAMVEPAPDLVGISEPTPSVAYDYVLLAGAHVPEENVAAVVKVMHEHPDELTAAFARFDAFDPDQMLKDLPIEYHDGAKKAYEELGQ
ncbi:TAXI family TRAP transporter solute-binding subunit [Sagittula stellata]|uniref:TRAP transporter solute receptor, TAXI family protein n=2 Tax=Sagittula stellata (strain ATCC 700073 / DSM 11524 / E-37) TaxID=388399 RepID=A3K478_SAGS3|nr:TAXI family TRAP transporter solute-binding subunit [Sagittula stellata]EBA07777.1 TRAP transporter solute receptor, TAXI family protein [Sagittula stellata E-37]